MPCSSIRSACSGSAGAGSTRQRAAVRESRGELRRRRDRAAGDAQQRIRYRDVRAGDVGGVALASARSSTKARSCRGGQRDGAGRRAHATARAEQRDVALVARAVRDDERRVEAPGSGERLAQCGAPSSGRSTTPTAPQSSACRAAAAEPGAATSSTRASDAARALAAHEVAGGGERRVGREQDVGVGRVRGRQQCDPGSAASAARNSRRAESPPSSARRTITAPRRAGAGADRRAARVRRRARAPPRPGRARVTAIPPARSLGRREQLEARAHDARARSRRRSRRRPAGRVAAARSRARTPGASSRATARSPAASERRRRAGTQSAAGRGSRRRRER